MKNHTSKEAFYERMRGLADVKNTSVNESKNRTLGTLVDFERASNGVAYGIIKEQHKYYIKKGGLNENQNVADFAYIGGLQNITEYQYGKLAEARKIRNMLLKTINEGLEMKVNPSGSKTMPTKGMLTEDKAGQEIEMAAQKVDDLDAATAAAAAPAPEIDPLNTDGEAEMDAGIEAMDAAPEGDPAGGMEDIAAGDAPVDDIGGGDVAPDLGGDDPMGDAPAPEGEEGLGDEMGGDVPPEGEEGGDVDGVAPEGEEGNEATREIEKSLGKLTNTLRKTELTEPQVKSYVNTFLSAFKDDFPEIDIEDRKEMADKITKVVPDSEIEDLGQNVEDTDGGEGLPEPEVELEEAGCDECGGFAQYAESRGYDANSVQECGEEEMTNLVSGYANAHGEGQNDGDFKAVALFITPEIIEKLKSEYGHDDFAGEVEPHALEMNETSEEDKAVQIAELFGGLSHMANKAKQGIQKGAQNLGQNIKQGAQNVGQNIKDKTQQVGQGIQQAATDVKQSYHAGEKNAALGKLEKVAADLGKQIAAVNNQAEKAGQEPINVRSILSTITNQVGGQSGAADLSKFKTNEGIPADHTEVQPMMEEEKIETDVEADTEATDDVLDLTKQVEKPEPEFGAGFEPMGGGVVKPDGAEVTTVEVTKDSVNVTMNETIEKLSETLDELSTGLAQKAGQMARDKSNQSYNQADELGGDVRGQQARSMERYVNPQIKGELNKIGAKAFGDGDDNQVGITIPLKSGGGVSLQVTPDGYKITNGDSSQIEPNIQRRLLRIIEMIKQDLVQPQASNELEEGQMNESEVKLRKYIRNRLQEHAGIKKPSLNENKKSEKLQKLDKMIDKQFNLYETVVKKKIDKQMKK